MISRFFLYKIHTDRLLEIGNHISKMIYISWNLSDLDTLFYKFAFVCYCGVVASNFVTAVIYFTWKSTVCSQSIYLHFPLSIPASTRHFLVTFQLHMAAKLDMDVNFETKVSKYFMLLMLIPDAQSDMFCKFLFAACLNWIENNGE